MPCVGKDLAQALADQLFRCAVGHRHQVHIALVLGFDSLGKELAQTRSGLARDLGSFGNPHQLCAGGRHLNSRGDLTSHPEPARLREPFAFARLGDGLNLVLVDEEIGLSFAGQAQHAVVEVFNPAANGFAIIQLDHHVDLAIAEGAQITGSILGLFEVLDEASSGNIRST